MALRTENGWFQVSANQCERIPIPGTTIVIPLQGGIVGRVMRAFIADFHAYVESLYNARGGTDEGGWTPTNSVATSNHLSGSAADLNWSDHTFRVSYAGFSPDKIARMRELLAWYEQLIFWGQDWTNPKDAMHVQIGYNTYGTGKLEDFARRKIRADGFSTFRRGGAGSPVVEAPVVTYLGIDYENTGPRVRALQEALNRANIKVDVDGDYGPLTAEAVTVFQRERGLQVDGIAGPQTIAALGLNFGSSTVVPAPIGGGLTPEVIVRLCEGQISLERARELYPLVLECIEDCGLTTIVAIAMFFAQLLHESGRFKYKREIASGQAYDITVNPDLARKLGNIHPGDGPRFRGRGFIQLTGRGHATGFSKWAYDRGLCPTPTYFVDNPEQMETDRNSFLVVTYYWTVSRPQLTALANAGDLLGVTKAINGGTNGLDDRRKLYTLALAQGANLLPPNPLDELEALLMANEPRPSQSHYRKDNKSVLTPLDALYQANAMKHEEMVEMAALRGEAWALRDIALLANGETPGAKDPDGQFWVNRAKYLLAYVSATNNKAIIAATPPKEA